MFFALLLFFSSYVHLVEAARITGDPEPLLFVVRERRVELAPTRLPDRRAREGLLSRREGGLRDVQRARVHGEGRALRVHAEDAQLREVRALLRRHRALVLGASPPLSPPGPLPHHVPTQQTKKEVV